MKVLSGIAILLLINLVLSSRYLQTSPFETCTVDLSINGELGVKDGKLKMNENFLCVSGGTPANSSNLKEALFQQGDYCFPNIYIYGLTTRFNSFKKFFYFRVHSPDKSGFSPNANIRYFFNGSCSPQELEVSMQSVMDQIIKSKNDAVNMKLKMFELNKKYNALVTKLDSATKSVPELQKQAEILRNNIKNRRDSINSITIEHNQSEVSCGNGKREVNELRQSILQQNVKANEISNNINSGLLALIELKEFLKNKDAAIKNTESIVNASFKKFSEVLVELRKILSNKGSDLDKVKACLEKRDSDCVIKAVDAFILKA